MNTQAGTASDIELHRMGDMVNITANAAAIEVTYVIIWVDKCHYRSNIFKVYALDKLDKMK
jgi:hypothetical protein